MLVIMRGYGGSAKGFQARYWTDSVIDGNAPNVMVCVALLVEVKYSAPMTTTSSLVHYIPTDLFHHLQSKIKISTFSQITTTPRPPPPLQLTSAATIAPLLPLPFTLPTAAPPMVVMTTTTRRRPETATTRVSTHPILLGLAIRFKRNAIVDKKKEKDKER